METQHFKIGIDAPREHVWNILWQDKTFREWTAAFAEGSHALTDWKEGSKVLFLDAKNAGMVSIITEKRPFEFMSFQHFGEFKNGDEDLEIAKQQGWAGAFENYTLKAVGAHTELSVEISTKGFPKEMLGYFLETWPKALEKIKQISEKR